MSHLQLSSSTFFQGGHKILRHPSEFLLLHPDVGSVFAEAGTEGDPQLRDLLLHQLELFKFFPREFKAVPLPSLQGLLQISEENSNTCKCKGNYLVVSMSICCASSSLLKPRILSKESFLRLISMSTFAELIVYHHFISMNVSMFTSPQFFLMSLAVSLSPASKATLERY